MRGITPNLLKMLSLSNEEWLSSTLGGDKTALHLACYVENAFMVEWLLSISADPNVSCAEWGTPLHIALRLKNKAVFMQLLATKPELNTQDKEGWTLLHHAVSCDWADVVETMITQECNFGIQDKGNAIFYSFLFIFLML